VLISDMNNCHSIDIYFSTYPNDKWIIKALVIYLFILENIQTAVVVFDAVTAFAKNFGNVDELEDVRLQWLSVPVLSAFSDSSILTFYISLTRLIFEFYSQLSRADILRIQGSNLLTV
jgi:hypothetical protein